MSDTIEAVMRTWVLVLPLIVAACGTDPTLEVSVVHPTGLSIASTSVTVYESSTLTCEQVEFGDLSADQLQAVAVAEETTYTVAPPTGALTGLSRTDPKIVVARGFGSDGKLAAAGCVEVDEVKGNDVVTITTDVAVTASISVADATGIDSYGVAVLTTDSTGKPIGGRPVSWRTYGPIGTAGATMTGLTMVDDGVWQPVSPSCTTDGTAVIHPVPPNLIGGYAVQVRIAWSIDPVPLYSALTKFDLAGSLAVFDSGTTTSPKVCALGHMAGNQATPVLACLGGAGRSATLYTATVANGKTTLSIHSSVPLNNPQIGLYSVAVGSDLDIYAVDAGGKITLVYGTAPAPTCKPAIDCVGLTADDLMIVPACGSASAKLLLHNVPTIPVGPDKQIKQIDLATGALTTYGTAAKTAEVSGVALVSFNAAGCVPDFDATTGTSTTEQVSVLDFTIPAAGVTPAITTSRAHFACPDSIIANCATVDLLGGAGVGFAAGASPYMVITTVDATGVVLVSSVLVTQKSGKHSLVELDRAPSASIPTTLATGQLDGDGGVDLVWQNLLGRGTELEVQYSRTVAGQALSALSPPELTVSSISIGDVTGDGFDDIVVTNKLGTGVAVIPTHVTPNTGTLMTDPTCSP